MPCTSSYCADLGDPPENQMLRRLEAVVLDLTHHAAVAKELSLGVYSAARFLLVGHRTSLADVYAAHDADIRRELLH